VKGKLQYRHISAFLVSSQLRKIWTQIIIPFRKSISTTMLYDMHDTCCGCRMNG